MRYPRGLVKFTAELERTSFVNHFEQSIRIMKLSLLILIVQIIQIKNRTFTHFPECVIILSIIDIDTLRNIIFFKQYAFFHVSIYRLGTIVINGLMNSFRAKILQD